MTRAITIATENVPQYWMGPGASTRSRLPSRSVLGTIHAKGRNRVSPILIAKKRDLLGIMERPIGIEPTPEPWQGSRS